MHVSRSLAVKIVRALIQALVIVAFVSGPFHHLVANAADDAGQAQHIAGHALGSNSHESAAKAPMHGAAAGDHQHQRSGSVDADKCGEFCHPVSGVVSIYANSQFLVHYAARFELSIQRGASLTQGTLRRPPRT